jgi:hypothetical protein
MTDRVKMLESQAIRPEKRFYRLNRSACVERAVDSLVKEATARGLPVSDLAHPHLAPLTREEKAEARHLAQDIVDERRTRVEKGVR